MTGTRGAGKSSIIRALLNEFKDQGLRMIEVSRDDLQMLIKLEMPLTSCLKTLLVVISSIVMT